MCNQLVVESFTVLSVTGRHFRAAARFVARHSLGLRAGDALHLAVASEHGAKLHALDQRLAEAEDGVTGRKPPARSKGGALHRYWLPVNPA